MYHLTNEKRVIKLPSLVYGLLKDKICENMMTWVAVKDEENLLGNRFEFMGVIYEKETAQESFTNTTPQFYI